MRVSLNNESGEPKYWFRGVVTQVIVKSVRGETMVEMREKGYTQKVIAEKLKVNPLKVSYAATQKAKKKRSFQNPNMSYAGLVRSVLSDYVDSDFINYASEGDVLGTLVMQYEETDWQFLKRMASRFYTGLMPAAAFNTPKLFFGLPDNQHKGELKAVNYTVQSGRQRTSRLSNTAFPALKNNKLGHAAKESKKRRFHALYDKVYRLDILWEAWRRVRADMGSAEIDGETLADIEKQREMFFVHECHRLLKEGDYHPQPVKRQYIPKKDADRAYEIIRTIMERLELTLHLTKT